MTEKLFSFTLSDSFLESYKTRPVQWGFEDAGGNSLGELTFLRTYSRLKEDGTKERWWEACARVINGMYSIQKDWCLANKLEWNGHKAQASAQEAYDLLFRMVWTPPGRGLEQMGAELVMKHKNSAALYNCSFVSSDFDRYDPGYIFAWAAEALMLGVGVGFDTAGAGKRMVHEPRGDEPYTFVIPDTREGWGEALRLLTNSYLLPDQARVEFDYSLIRPAGERIKTFGGTASGPEPLEKGLNQIREVWNKNIDEKVTSTTIVDTFNIIATFVLSGGARRSALISLGDPLDESYIRLKDKDQWEARPWFWTSNNSVVATQGMDYSHLVERTVENGEPGYIWLDTAKNYGRLVDAPDHKDTRIGGANPCLPAWAEVWKKKATNGRPGAVLFADIKAGDEIWSNDGWVKVTKKWSNGHKDVYRYHVAGGDYIDATSNHKVMSKGKKVEIGEAEFIDAINLPHHRPSKRSMLIVDVEFLGNFEVFDITVNGKSHTFWCNGFSVSNCSEIFLESFEVCNLSEMHIARAESKDEFIRGLKYAYLYSKTVTLLPTPWPKTNAVMMRNRRIGLSITGIAAFVENNSQGVFRDWADEGYKVVGKWDELYSEWLAVRPSIRTTAVKPSGSVSLLSGSTPGVHWSPGGSTYMRAIRFSEYSPEWKYLEAAGYKVEDDLYANATKVVYFPIKTNHRRSEKEVSIFEKIHLAAEAQKYWADNGVSVTVSFDKDSESEHIERVLEMYEGQLKAVSFLPMGNEVYPQQPYSSLTVEEWDEWQDKLLRVDWDGLYNRDDIDMLGERYCTTDVCEIPDLQT